MENNSRSRDGLFSISEEDVQGHIFREKDLLTISHLPEESRIIGRDEQIAQLAEEIEPVIIGYEPNSALIYGKTGCGKSLVAKYVARLAEEEAEERGYNLAYGICDCSQSSKEASVIQTIADSMNTPTTGISVPSRGISTDEYYKRLWDILDEAYDGGIIILDEIDHLKSDDVLMVLSRANESEKIDVPLAIIGISNKIDYRNRLSERVKSSFSHREFIFDPYDSTQLEAILRNRSDAFQEGVLKDEVVPYCAALAAKKHGDARKAMNLLKFAGEYAKRKEKDEVSKEDVDAAEKDAEAERLLSLISGLSPHVKYVLKALANLTKNNKENWFRTSRIVDTYEKVCEKEGVDVLSLSGVRDCLNEVAFLSVIEGNRETGGRGVGNYKEWRLLTDADTVIRMEKLST